MRVLLKFVLPCEPDAAWAAIRNPEVLRAISSPLITLRSLEPNGFPAAWEHGSHRVEMRAAGRVPIGVQVINVTLSEVAGTVSGATEETGTGWSSSTISHGAQSTAGAVDRTSAIESRVEPESTLAGAGKVGSTGEDAVASASEGAVASASEGAVASASEGAVASANASALQGGVASEVQRAIEGENAWASARHSGRVRMLRDSGGAESGLLRLVSGWQHRMAISAAPGGGTLYRDELRFSAGILAPLVWPAFWAFWQLRALRIRQVIPSFEPQPGRRPSSSVPSSTP